MSVPTRRELQKQERRNQLIDTALALYAEKGVENTTIKDIAERAAVAQGLVYHYFASKDDLLWAILERHNPLPVMRETLADITALPVRDALIRLATTAYHIMGERRAIVTVIAREALTRPELQQRIFTLQQVGIGLFVAYMDGRIAAGEIRAHRPEVTARMFMGGVIALRLSNAPASFIPEMIDNLLIGIAVR